MLCYLFISYKLLSTAIFISCSFFVLIFPIIPSSSFLFLTIINLFFVTVCIFLVGFSLSLFSLCSINHILVLQFSDFIKSHSWFICIFLPNLCNYILSFFTWTHAMVYLLSSRNLPNFNFGNWL